MTTLIRASALAAVLACAVPAPAMAAVQLLSFGGMLDYGSNNSADSPFGTSGTSLTNQTYTVKLSYDPSLFTAAGSSSCGAASNTSCTFTFSAARPLTETITVGSTTKVYTLTTGQITLSSSGAGNADNFGFNFNSSGLSLSGFFQDGDGFFPNQARVNEPIFSTFSNLAVTGASFQQNGPGYSFGDTVTRLNASYTATAVPEPATWAMLLVGFALMGAAIRYRRRATTIAYA